MKRRPGVTKLLLLTAMIAPIIALTATTVVVSAGQLDAFDGINRFGAVALPMVLKNYHGPALDSEETRHMPPIQFTLFPSGKVAWIHRYEMKPQEHSAIEASAIAQLREAIAKAAPLPFPSDCLKQPLVAGC